MKIEFVLRCFKPLIGVVSLLTVEIASAQLLMCHQQSHGGLSPKWSLQVAGQAWSDNFTTASALLGRTGGNEEPIALASGADWVFKKSSSGCVFSLSAKFLEFGEIAFELPLKEPLSNQVVKITKRLPASSSKEVAFECKFSGMKHSQTYCDQKPSSLESIAYLLHPLSTQFEVSNCDEGSAKTACEEFKKMSLTYCAMQSVCDLKNNLGATMRGVVNLFCAKGMSSKATLCASDRSFSTVRAARAITTDTVPNSPLRNQSGDSETAPVERAK